MICERMRAVFGPKKYISRLLYLLLLIALPLGTAGCVMKSHALDLMDGIGANKVVERESSEAFISASQDFAFKLFQKSLSEDKNTLISPLSVMLALAMTANGAEGKTLAEMEALLGGDIPLDHLNEYLHTFVNSLPSQKKSKLALANSIWFRDDKIELAPNQDFLQTNADYYNAQLYKSAFDGQAISDINNWVKKHTDGLIDKIVEEIEADTFMFLINALVFDAEWQEVYKAYDVVDGVFKAHNGEKQSVKMMYSQEFRYIDDGQATGFVKFYKNLDYSFAALLPNEDVDLSDYIASLDGESFVSMIKNATQTAVCAGLPKFSYDYELKMNQVLAELGMPTAFDENLADFSRISNSVDLFISEVLHKTFISVDELGTKAGAVTKVEIKDTAMPEMKYVKLDRPFVYAIVDNHTGLPIFLGAVQSLGD